MPTLEKVRGSGWDQRFFLDAGTAIRPNGIEKKHIPFFVALITFFVWKNKSQTFLILLPEVFPQISFWFPGVQYIGISGFVCFGEKHKWTCFPQFF